LEDILFVIITTSSYMYVNYIWRERSQMWHGQNLESSRKNLI